MSKEHPPHSLHVPVLLDACIDQLRPIQGETYLDLTAGYGGHAQRFLEVTGNMSGAVLVDRDDYAIERLSAFAQAGTRLMHTDFVSAAKVLIEEGRAFDIVLIDLGVSSPQLDQSERGFSFRFSAPLDMRMDRRQSVSAAQLVNTLDSEELAQIIHKYGEEPYSMARRIAEKIVLARPLETTDQLADVVRQAIPRQRIGKIHPATRTFQALRIAVNDELQQVESILKLLPKLLKSGGRAGIISFHSLEDRLVKQYFRSQHEAGYEAELMVLTKRPIDGATYDVHNPRSRSSKLRVAVKK